MAVFAVTRPTIAFAAPGGVVVIGRCRLRDCDPGISAAAAPSFPVVAAFAPARSPYLRVRAHGSAVRTAAATASATATAPTAVIDGGLYTGPAPTLAGNSALRISLSMNFSIAWNFALLVLADERHGAARSRGAPYGRYGGYNPRGRAAHRN